MWQNSPLIFLSNIKTFVENTTTVESAFSALLSYTFIAALPLRLLYAARRGLCVWLDIYILHTLANQFHNSPTDCILRIRLSFNYIQSWHCAPHRSGAQPLQKSLEKLLHRRKPPQLHKPRLPKYRLWDFHIKLGISNYRGSPDSGAFNLQPLF